MRCIVIEMVSGKPTWEDCGVDILFRIGFSNELLKFPTQLPDLGRDFLEKCLRREPTERWSCDQQLQHPFISSSSPNYITEASSRSVLNCFNFSDDDDFKKLNGARRGGYENLSYPPAPFNFLNGTMMKIILNKWGMVGMRATRPEPTPLLSPFLSCQTSVV